MKNLLLLIAVTFSLNIIGQVPTYAPNNGLVGYWGFNGNANDESINTNDGTVNGAALTTDRFGNTNSAYSFGGSSWIEVSDQASLSNEYLGVSVWIRTTSAQIQSILYKTDIGVATNEEYSIAMNYPIENQYDMSVKNGNNCTNPGVGWQRNRSTITLNDNSWHHIVFNYSGVNSSVFIDNILMSDSSFTASVIDNCLGGPLLIGRNWNNSFFFSGEIDDIGIWNRALTKCEIQDLYSSQLNSTFVSAGANQTICNGDPVTLTASNSMNYGWNNSVVDGTPFSPTATSNYIVTADSAGCISIDSLTVTVNQLTESSINETATDTYTSPSGIVYDSTGVYNDTIPNAMQCDSVITINLTMEYTGINEYNSSLISLFPNPASNKITINGLNDLTDITKIEITSITGAIVRKENITNSVIDISMLNSGMYLLFISHENGFEKISFLKE